MAERILIVEDSVDLAFGLRINFESEGYSVKVAGTVATACEALHDFVPQLVILDLMLPDGNGLEVLRHAKTASEDCIILILSARVSEFDRVAGLRLEADDYVTKPFSVRELVERVKILLRGRANRVIMIGEARVDLSRHLVTTNGRSISLTRQESRLLNLLLRHAGEVVPRKELLAEAWGFPDGVQTRALDYCISRLRRKLEPDPANPRHLLTVSRQGFRLVR